METILIILIIIFAVIIAYMITSKKKTVYEPTLKWRVNSTHFSEHGAKIRVEYLEKRGLDFTIEVHDGYSWKPFGKNVKPPQWER